MRILRATHLGFCFGVRDAINLALDHPGPITVLGDLVHNPAVLEELAAHGVQFAHGADQIQTQKVMITAHGASNQSREALRGRGFALVEAICPLVERAHQAVLKLAWDGYHPVIVGRHDHTEVRGLTGDLEHFDVILREEDVTRLAPRARFGVIAQTTQPIDRVHRLVALVRARFPAAEVRFVDTVCLPTKQRQQAAVALALEADVVVVVGGAGSNNTRELAATCGKYCPRVHSVQTAADLRPDWFTGAETIGLTAGTSTPDDLIDEVEHRLNELAAPPAFAPAEAISNSEDHAPALAVHAL